MSKISDAIARHAIAQSYATTLTVRGALRLALKAELADEDDDVTHGHLFDALNAIGERRGWRNAAHDVAQGEIDYGKAPGKAKHRGPKP